MKQIKNFPTVFNKM